MTNAQDERTRRFVTLMGVYDKRMFGYVLSMVPNFADAEELAQQVRLRLWEQFDEYDVTKDFGAWARTIAHYLVLAHYKRSTTSRVRFCGETLEAIAAQVSALAEREDDRNWALQECLGKLTHAKRQLLMRYYSTGESLRDIAMQIDRSFDAVRQSVLRTRIALTDCVERAMRREAG